MSSLKGLTVACWLLVVFNTTGHAQGTIADSLERILPKSHGNTRVDILNQLTFEFITRDNDKVVRYSNEAIQLSETVGYIKGKGIAHTYRGVYEYISGDFSEAHQSLHLGLKFSEEAGDRENMVYTYVQLGNCGLEEVDNDSAYHYFTKAYSIFRENTNPETLSKIYRNMSAVYGQRSQQDSQQYYLDKAIELRRTLPDKTLLVDALALQATNKLNSGDVVNAEKLLDEADEILTQYPEDLENLHDVHHVRALILFQRGEFEKATVLFDSARNYYSRTSLLRKYVTLLTDLGKVFSDRGEYELALNNLYDALRLARIRGFETETYTIRTMIGWVNFNLGDLGQALRLANESLATRPKKQLESDLANALTLKGVVLTSLNQYPEARETLDSVLRMHRRAQHVRGTSETLMNLGFLETKLGHFKEALKNYDESLRLAEQGNYTFGLSWSNWGTGDIYFRLGDYRKATIYLDRSEKFARLVHANETLVRTYNTRRDLLAAQGKYKESLRYSIRASELKDSIHHTDLARRFANLEKIQEIEERDKNIRDLQNEKKQAEEKLDFQESRIRQQYVLLLLGVMSIILLGILLFIYNRFYSRIKTLNNAVTEKNKSIHAQAAKLQEVNSELNRLYSELSEQNEEIQTQANELTESNRSISDLNRDLERLVAEKTVELRTTNDELAKHNNELLQFSYTVSHNLRGPVARLLGLSSMIETEHDLEQAKQWVKLISKTASDLDIIIKDLSKILDLRNEVDQYREAIDLDQEWKLCMSLLQDTLTGQEEIESDFKNLPQIITVRAMLQSIFYNLLSNAIKFRSPERKLKVVIASKLVDKKAVIEISDNGLGFDTTLHREKLFKLYKRFHSHVAGRGLGLYMIRSQVEVLHGDVEVESVPDKGTKFTVTLPLVTGEIAFRH